MNSHLNKLLIIIFFTISAYANEVQIDSISYSKIKKLVEKEELIAKAYKKYIKDKGTVANLNTLIIDDYLPEGFSNLNLFGKEIKINTTLNELENTLFRKNKDNVSISFNLKPNVYDYYYSNKYREYTKSPISVKSKNITIDLSDYEKYIIKYRNLGQLTTTKNLASNKYYLDPQGLLHWYNSSTEYKYTLSKDLVLDESVIIFNSDGTIKQDFTDLFNGKNVLYAGQTLFHPNNNGVDEYLHLGNGNGIIKVGKDERDIGKTILQFTRRAGGIIINGDIYTWGNNANKITGVDINPYLNTSSNNGNHYPVLTSLVRVKAKSYNSSIDNKNYFSSPLRPKFIDFFSTVYHSTCGISINGELYCTGSQGIYSPFTYTEVQSGSKEMLYRSNFFNGTDGRKATKIFANNQSWLILANTKSDGNGGYQDGQIYRWGIDYAGFSGNSSNNFYKYYNTGSPTELEVFDSGVKVKFKDITYLLTIGYRKMGALSNEGDVYLWGLDNYYNSGCSKSQEGVSINLCKPYKIPSEVDFAELKGGLQGFVAKDKNGKYYKIYQKYGYLPKIVSINELIKSYNNSEDNKYIESDDSEILSVDLSSRLNGSSLVFGEGIVWINGKNQLKGDYFTSANKNDDFFKASIKKIKWKKIKVVEDDNGMCGIDIYNQIYCWGIASYYRKTGNSSTKMGNTFMLPVFNTNLQDLDKDYLVAEGGSSSTTATLTNMTSGDWKITDSKGNQGAFFMKYPTYIGGFNYEFTFK